MALYSQVPYVQSQIARNLQGGLASLGNRPLDEAKFNLEKVKTESGLARQAAADQRAEELFQLQKPGMEVQSMAAQNQLEQAKAPVRLTDFMTDMNTAEHMLWTPQDNYMGKNAPKETRDPAITKLAQMYGASWDVDPNSPTRGQMIRPDGTVVTKLDINRDAAPLKAFMVANSGMEHTMRSAKEKLLRSYQKGQINEAQYSQGVNQIAKFESSLPMQMKYAQQQIDFLSRFTNAGNPLFQGEISQGLQRWKDKYDKLSGTLEKRREKLDDRDFEKYKMRFKRDTELMVQELKNKKDLTTKEQNALNALKIQHVVGFAQENGLGIQFDPESNTVVGSMTDKEIEWLKPFAKNSGLTVYKGLPTGEERDRPGLFTGDDQLYNVSLVPNYSEKGSQPVKTPQKSDVNSFIDKQLGRYPDVNKPQAVQAPELAVSHNQTPLPRSEKTEDTTPTGYKIDGKDIYQSGNTLIIKDGDKFRLPNKDELARIGDIIRKKQIETSPRMQFPNMPKMPNVDPIAPGQGLPQ